MTNQYQVFINMNTVALKLIGLGFVLFFSSLVQGSEIITVESRQSEARTALGSTVIPYKEVTLSAQMPGRIEYLGGDVGSAFEQGVLLAKINEDDLKAKRHSAMAQLSNARAALRNARTQYMREVISPRSKDITQAPGFGLPTMMDIYMTRPMANMMNEETSHPDMVRYSDLVNRATQYSQAQGSVLQAKSQLAELNAKLRDTQAIAPFTGMILQKLVEVGDTVQPGQPLIKYGYIKFLRLRADVPSSLVSSLSLGLIVPVRIDSLTDTEARVSQIYPIADPARHTVTVKFDLPMDTIAAPGMYAEVYIPDVKRGDRHHSTLVIPRSALIRGRSLPAVLVIDNENNSQLRMVRLGAEQRRDFVEVVSGLKEGERIINAPPSSASSGWMPAQNKDNEKKK